MRLLSPWLYKWPWKTLLLPCTGFIVCWWVSVIRVMCRLICGCKYTWVNFWVKGLTEMKMIRWRDVYAKSSPKWIKIRCLRYLSIKKHTCFTDFNMKGTWLAFRRSWVLGLPLPSMKCCLDHWVCHGQLTHLGISHVQVLIFKFKVATTVYQTAA